MIVSMVKVGESLRPVSGEQPRINRFKERLSEGQVVRVNFSVDAPASYSARRYFHVIRDAYARAMGYEKEYAKDELCIGFGIAMTVADALEDPPEWAGHVRTIWGREYVRKSTAAYTREEMAGLIEGAIQACLENGIDIDELLAEYRRSQNGDGNDAA